MQTQEQTKRPVGYDFPKTKLRNITCVHCKHQFWIRDISLKGPHLPLLLECGHSSCEECSKHKKTCPLCRIELPTANDRNSLLPLNVYILGLTVMSKNYFKTVEDPDISFRSSHESKLRQSTSQSLCHECGILASVQCEQCNVPFCSLCFSKIHRRALQNHKQIPLPVANGDNPLAINNTCSEKCSESLQYYCVQCEESVCSHCMIRLHQKHEYVFQKMKNEELVPELQEVCDNIAESLQRILQVQKKVQSMLTVPSQLQNGEAVEAAISKHFAHLHGVLQNLERKMIDKLERQRDYTHRNLEDILEKLADEKDELQAALVMAASAKESLDRINLKEVIDKLKEFKNVPCHLVQNVVQEKGKLEFEFDLSIINALEKHCSIKEPPMVGFDLLEADDLPEDYEIEPLAESTDRQSFLEVSLTPSLKSLPSETAELVKPANPSTVEGTTVFVKVLYIHNPDCFYVTQLSNIKQFKTLHTSLQSHGSVSKSPTDIAINKIYAFSRALDERWYRGRVQRIKRNNQEEIISCEMFYIDLGRIETDVPVSQIREMSKKLTFLPPLAKKCKLHEIVPAHGRWDKDATQHFITMIRKHTEETSMYILKEYGDTYSVDLRTHITGDSSPCSVRDSLVYLGFGHFITQQKLMRLNPQSVCTYYPDQLEIKKFVDVKCISAASLDSIYVQKEGESTDYFDKLMTELNHDYTYNLSSKTMIYTPEVGLPCAVQDFRRMWYRGLITAVGKFRKYVEVFYVDLGHKADVPFDKIRRLPNYYMKCKTQAIKVSIRNLKCPPGDEEWAAAATKCLQKYLLHLSVQVIAIEKIDDTYSVHIILTDDLSKTFVNLRHFISSELVHSQESTPALPVPQTENKHPGRKNRKAVKKTTKTSTKERHTLENALSNINLKKSQEKHDPFKICVRVHKVESPDCIYVSDVAYEEISLRLTDELQDFYGKYHSDQCVNWEVGDVCVVYVVPEKLYYRGSITEVKSPKDFDVYLYDVGTVKTISTECIQPLNPPFAAVPAYLFKIKLAGLLPCGGSSRWPSVSCEKLATIVEENQNRKFYISRMMDSEDDLNVEKEDNNETTEPIAVELWLKQVKTDGPLSPTRTEIISINRMLLNEGLALPNKRVTAKEENILAIDLQRKLQKSQSMKTRLSSTVKWKSLNSVIDDLNEIFVENVSESCPNTDSDSQNDEDDKPRIAAWLPAEPIMDNAFTAVGSYFDNNGVLYVHHKDRSSELLSNIEAKLSNYDKQYPLNNSDRQWVEGDVCIAQYHNKKWYRGRVNKVNENGNVEVEFVDYGNVEDCPLGTVKKKLMFQEVPAQCIKCVLHGLEPATDDDKWNVEDLDKIHMLLVDHEFTVHIIERKPTHLVVSVIMHHPEPQELLSYLYYKLKLNIKIPYPLNINDLHEKGADDSDSCDAIIDDCISIFCDQTIKNNTILELSAQNVEEKNDYIVSGSPVIGLTRNLNDINNMTSQFENITWEDIIHADEKTIITSTPQNESCEGLQQNYPALKIPNDVTVIEIELCCPIDPITYCARLHENKDHPILHKYYKEYEELMKTLQNYACKQPKLQTIERNALCCAQFIDGFWYRCVITECEAKSETIYSICLQFVDYGNEEDRDIDVNNHELYALNEEWLKVPSMAIRCKLWGVELHPATSFQALLPKLEDIHNIPIVAEIKERKNEYFETALYKDKTCTEFLYSSFIEEGFFINKKAKED